MVKRKLNTIKFGFIFYEPLVQKGKYEDQKIKKDKIAHRS